MSDYDFKFLVCDNRKAFVIAAVNDRDRKIIRRTAAATDGQTYFD
jgi:hypothetical protein